MRMSTVLKCICLTSEKCCNCKKPLQLFLPFLFCNCQDFVGFVLSLHRLLTPPRSGQDPIAKLVPILVGNLTANQEVEYGKLLAHYLNDPTSVFVASSDFCHWGSRFGYTYYQFTPDISSGIQLGGASAAPTNPSIHESIKVVDHLCMDAIETGAHKEFTDIIAQTRNSVCGRHPIGVVMAALEFLEQQSSQDKVGRFKFVRYERSSLCRTLRDSSVSYASAYAVIPKEVEK